MTFLNPLVLFGLIASSIPIIIHLLNLRKLKKIEFSTLAFLKELQKNKIRKIKIKQILLLIIRTLILIFLVFAFARPVLRGYLSAFGSHAKTSAIIILDDSFSMNLSDEYGQYFKQAKFVADNIIDLLEEGDDLSILRISDLSKPVLQSSSNFQGAKKLIESADPAFKFDKISTALKIASNLFSESKNFNKEIFLISDFQNSHFKLSEDESKPTTKLFDENTKIFLAKVGNKRPRNVSISSVEIKNKIFEINKPVTISVSITNNSSDVINDEIASVYLEGKRVTQKNITISENSIQTIELTIIPKNYGYIKGYIEIEDDDLLQDNRGYFSIYIPDKIKILILENGGVQNQFLKIALSAANMKGDSASSQIFEISSNTGLSTYNLNQFNVIILSGANITNKDDISKLKNYIQSGGGLIVFPPDPFNLNIFNNFMSEIGLPAAQGVFDVRYDNQKSYLSFSKTDYDHQIFEGLYDKDPKLQKETDSPEIYYCILIQSSNLQSVITLSNNNSFLSEYKDGNKKVLIYSLAPNLDWSNFPIKGSFLPIIIRSVFYLSNNNGPIKPSIVGDDIQLNFSNTEIQTKDLIIKTPVGTEEKISLQTTVNGFFYNYRESNYPGLYEIFNNDKLIKIAPVNLNPLESNLSTITDSDLEQFLNSFLLKDRAIKISPNTDISTEIKESRYGIELWKYLIMIVLLLIIIEMFIAKDSKKQIAELSTK